MLSKLQNYNSTAELDDLLDNYFGFIENAFFGETLTHAIQTFL